MKKLLLLITVSAISFGSFAQTQLGIKVGYNSSKITSSFITDKNLEEAINKTYNDFRSLGGLYVGLVYTKNKDGFFSFQQEIAFSQKGVKSRTTDAYYRYNYIDVKPLFNIGGGGEKWKIYMQLGPSINVWLSKALYNKDGKFIDKSDEWAEENDDNGVGVFDVRAELGLVLGGGFKYKLGPGWILFNPRYEWGVSPKTIVDLGSEGYMEVNRTFSLNTGYLYQF